MPSVSEVAIVGSGRVARAFGRALGESGVPIACVAARSLDRATQAAAFIGGGAVAVSFPEAARRAGRVLIAVSDTAIESVARELAIPDGKIRLALHTCGNAGPELLSPLAGSGASCAVIHPLQTVHHPEPGAHALRGAFFGVWGDEEAAAWARELAGRLNGEVLTIAPEARPLYHAAAVMASNYVAALLDAAVEAMGQAGVPADLAIQALTPLARAAVENAAAAGPLQALTGPIVRGDISTVAAHLGALTGAGEPMLALYRAAGLRALDMARRRGLREEKAAALNQLLRGGK